MNKVTKLLSSALLIGTLITGANATKINWDSKGKPHGIGKGDKDAKGCFSGGLKDLGEDHNKSKKCASIITIGGDKLALTLPQPILRCDSEDKTEECSEPSPYGVDSNTTNYA